ncbi:MAG: HAMP domain-containing histidine kinase [Cryobacterium sp.]|nr:HAMP domain-containing histidine kinase [Oligoflexia bacterium]
MLLMVLGTTLVVYSVVLYRNFVKIHESEFDTALYNYTVDIAKSLNVNLFGEVFLSDDVRHADEKIFPFALERTLIQLRTTRGAVIAKSRDLGEAVLPITDTGLDQIIRQRTSFMTEDLQIREAKPTRYRIANLFIDQPGDRDYVLQVASPMILLERERRGLLAFFLLSIPATLGIAGVLSYTLSGQATKPINDIINKAKAITARKINERLPVPKVKDEIYQLATTLNGLLERLQKAFMSQEAFVADASHQLKTPLAILRGEIDMAMKENRTGEEQRAFLESASQEIRYLSRMVEQLLIIARLESGHSGIMERHPTRLDELAIEVISRMEKHASIASKKTKLAFRFEGDDDHADYTMLGDFDLLRTLMESLIDNALKYTRPDTTVAVEVRDHGKNIEFRVTDQGEGLGEEEKERIFGRFWRSPKVENSPVKGSGLGLSIVKKIADAHHASLEVNSTPGVGSQFSVIFPKES